VERVAHPQWTWELRRVPEEVDSGSPRVAQSEMTASG
jgi:hypothetical protein